MNKVDQALATIEREIDQFTIGHLLDRSLKNLDDLEFVQAIAIDWLSAYSEHHLFLSPYLAPMREISNRIIAAQNRLKRLNTLWVEILDYALQIEDSKGILEPATKDALLKDAEALFSDPGIQQKIISLTPAGFSEFKMRAQEHLPLKIADSCSYVFCCGPNYYRLSIDRKIDARLATGWLNEILQRESAQDIQALFGRRLSRH